MEDNFTEHFNRALWMLIHGGIAMQQDDDDSEEVFAETASAIIAALITHACLLGLQFLEPDDAAQMISSVARDALANNSEKAPIHAN